VDNSPAPKKETRSNTSAGLLMFRRRTCPGPGRSIDIVEFLLVHPGGPFWKNKDDGSWSIPKGQVQSGEDRLTRAQIEFEEELGIKPVGNWIPLDAIKQKAGKMVYAWAFESDLPRDFQLKSNTFEIEFPPRSGKFKQFPEVDRAEFFPEPDARRKLNPAQVPFIERLLAALRA
jgi:predicted NUDIX family NTP pyrophosphohydrolase